MAQKLGRPLHSDEHVHHKDEDFTNNAPHNLEILDPTAHAQRHHPPNPVPRWLRPARRAYMREYLKYYRRAS